MNSILKYTVSNEALAAEPREALRYLGYKKAAAPDADILLAADWLKRVRPVLRPAACYSEFEISFKSGGLITLPWGEIKSLDLSKNLQGCKSVYIFAATIGIDFDRLLCRARLSSMADAAFIQAAGATYIESFVDGLCGFLKNEAAGRGLKCKARYSPGFGDFVLENQIGLFSVLNPSKHIGLSLKENCIMVPEKSVTAIMGLYE
mgnify:CR=1 FL=1